MSVTTPPAGSSDPASPAPAAPRERQAVSLFRRDIVKRALLDSLIKLDPRVQIRNPVMFVVEIGAVITTITWLIQAFGGRPLGGGNEPAWYALHDRGLALADGDLRQHGRGVRRRPRPSPGRHAALDASGDGCRAARR